MKILITNDDGIFSSGIYALWEVAKEFGSVYVVAPDSQKSAAGHSITISKPLFVNSVFFFCHWAQRMKPRGTKIT